MFKFNDATVLIINYCFRESIKISTTTQTPTTKQNNNTLFVFVKICYIVMIILTGIVLIDQSVSLLQGHLCINSVVFKSCLFVIVNKSNQLHNNNKYCTYL